MNMRHICVVSGKRGGFGAMSPTMDAIAKHPRYKREGYLFVDGLPVHERMTTPDPFSRVNGGPE